MDLKKNEIGGLGNRALEPIGPSIAISVLGQGSFARPSARGTRSTIAKPDGTAHFVSPNFHRLATLMYFMSRSQGRQTVDQRDSTANPPAGAGTDTPN